MVNRILVDTNVLLDYLLIREPFYEDAEKIVQACVEGTVKGCISAHSMGKIEMKRNTARTIRLVGYKLMKEESADGKR